MDRFKLNRAIEIDKQLTEITDILEYGADCTEKSFINYLCDKCVDSEAHELIEPALVQLKDKIVEHYDIRIKLLEKELEDL